MRVHGKVREVPVGAYYKLCQRVTEQIVFPEDGFDADFENFKFNLHTLIEVCKACVARMVRGRGPVSVRACMLGYACKTKT